MDDLDKKTEIQQRKKMLFKPIENNGFTNKIFSFNKGKKYQISRLVWEAFKGEIPSDCNVTHKNGLYRDNSLYNLRLIKKDQHKKIIKKHQQPVADLKNRVIYKSLREAERKLKVRRRWISLCCRGLRKGTSINVAWWDRENRRAYRGEFRECVES